MYSSLGRFRAAQSAPFPYKAWIRPLGFYLIVPKLSTFFEREPSLALLFAQYLKTDKRFQCWILEGRVVVKSLAPIRSFDIG